MSFFFPFRLLFGPLSSSSFFASSRARALELGTRVAVGDLRGADEERALERRVVRGLRLREVLLREVLPPPALHLAALDRLLGTSVAGAEREDTAVRRERASVVEQHVVTQPRELEGQLGLAVSGRERRLDLEEVRDGLVLAPHLVCPACSFEERRELAGAHRAGIDRAFGSRIAESRTELVPGLLVVGFVLENAQGVANRVGAHLDPG